MNKLNTWLLGTRHRWLWACMAVLMAGLLPTTSRAALTDIATEPLATYVSVKTKPNILFVLDNSGSMGWDYMPDDVNNAASSYTTTYGYKSAQCNGVAYDPSFTYAPPLKDDGSSYPNASFAAANPNGYGPTLSDGTAYYSGSTNTTGTGSKTFDFTSGFLAGLFNGFNFLGGLPSWSVGDVITAVDQDDDNHWVIGTITSISNSGFLCPLISCTRSITINVTSYNGTDSASDWKVNKIQSDSLANSTYYVYTGSETKMGWTYTAAGVVNSTFKNECISHPGAPTGEAGDGKFTGVVVTATSAEAQNYANWYQYYRTRMLMMRTAAGRAFQPLTNRYRIGFSTINNTGIVESSVLSTISAGNAFLNVRDYDTTQRSLFLQRLYNTTPSGGTPLRSALSKAGRYFAKQVSGQTYDPVQYACQRNYAFLSTDGYWNDSSNPKQLNGTTDIGQQDAADVRPFSDGGSTTKTTVTTVTERRETTTPATVSQLYTRNTYVYGSYSAGGCFLSYKETITPQTTTTTTTGNQVVTTDWTTTTTVSETITAGVSTSSTSVSGPVSSQVSSTAPTPAAPSGTATWTNGTATNSCQGSKQTTPGAAYPSGAATVTPTGSAVTVVLSTTTNGPTSTVAGGSGGTANTLADVAEYYYVNDLRTSALGNCTAGTGGSGDVCDNSAIRASGRDTALWQHMSTFTLGLGVNGTLAYDPVYLDHANDATSSYYKLIKGTLDWPAPVSNNVTTIDDLWHTAVNGRGQYFGAKNATELTNGLKVALSSMGRVPGAGSSLGVSSIQPSGSNNLAFSASYATVDWTGDITASTVLTTGALSSLSGTGQSGVDNLAWRGGRTADARNIYYRKPSTTTLSSFTYANLLVDSLGGNFSNFCSKSVSDTSTVAPLQCATLNVAQKLIANNGIDLVNWLRGYSVYEDTNIVNPIFRGRLSALGDIVNSTPAYVGPPSQLYADSGYAAYKTAQKSRKPVVYVGANDGMLHAFSADTSEMGKELWAFVPTAVMPNMFRLANTDYANYHQYLVDGSPTVADVQTSGGVWKTILVAGLNSGGKSLYALDITDPASPKFLWEFTDTDLGYTYGKPVITKRANGTWVTVFASGYNNTGNGYLYVRNAYTGAQEVAKIPTNIGGVNGVGGVAVGTAASPSGLARINAWIDSTTDNTALRFYGGDLKGNLWRFDIVEGSTPTGRAQRLGYFQVDASTPQPIMVRPALAQVTSGGTNYPVVAVGTGRYLGVTDITDSTQQSIYAIKDTLAMNDAGDLRGNALVVAQTVTTDSAGSSRSVSTNAVDWSTKLGWRVDLPSSKERTTADLVLQYNTLLVGAGIPGTGSTCSASGGTGWLYYIDIATGGNVTGATKGATAVPGGLVTGSSYLNLNSTGGGNAKGGVTDSGGGSTLIDLPPPPPSGTPTLRRASWRELFNN